MQVPFIHKISIFKSYSTVWISYAFIFLFVYAAVSKLLEFKNFQAQLSQSPMISAYTEVISYALLGIELFVALLLALPKYRNVGLNGAFILMVLFTTYLIVILRFSSYIPCSCGGILEKMTWEVHLIFNTVLSLLLLIVLLLNATDTKKMALRLFIICCICVGFILLLFYYSEKKMHQENPFIRRYIQGAATKTAGVSLPNNTLYFAGSDGSTLYLADRNAPLYLFAYDTTLQSVKKIKIELERDDFPFISVQVKIKAPYFYLLDGTVPVIYKGEISNWKAKVLMADNHYYFSKSAIVDEDQILFRAQKIETNENVLGTFHLKDSFKINYYPALLEKQLDGFFDTDGLLAYDHKSQKGIYLYFYRNQYIVIDKNMQMVKSGKTIDTVSKATIDIAYLPETGQRMLAKPPLVVNSNFTFSDSLVLIHSKRMGRFESKKMWQQASIVDLYNSSNNTYLSSIYIYHVDSYPLNDLLLIDDCLYVLIGPNLHKYQLNKLFYDVSK